MFVSFNKIINLKKIKKFFFAIKLVFYIPKKVLKLKYDEKIELRKHLSRKQALGYLEKRIYMISSEWKTMQKIWLHEKGYRCQMFPFIFLGQHKPSNSWYDMAINGRFAIHHMNKNAYKNLGKEVLDRDVLVLSRFAHDFIFHKILSFGARKVADQKSINNFPNPLQIIANKWCLLNNWLKLGLLILIYLCL